jgi:hypothetical protein
MMPGIKPPAQKIQCFLFGLNRHLAARHQPATANFQLPTIFCTFFSSWQCRALQFCKTPRRHMLAFSPQNLQSPVFVSVARDFRSFGMSSA